MKRPATPVPTLAVYRPSAMALAVSAVFCSFSLSFT